MPNKHTFLIEPIRALLARYVNGGVWADPFAGENSPAEWTNDLNPDKPTKYHLDAEEFAKIVPNPINGVLFDPPYSTRQAKEVYNGVGRDFTMDDAQTVVRWGAIKNILSDKLNVGGLAICCGWNTIGFGKERGYKLEEILIVCHGGAHNDTLVTVERKVQAHLEFT